MRYNQPPEVVHLYSVCKRIFDFVLSLIALIVLSPVLLCIAAVIKATSPGPILFRQKRSGLHRRPFTIYKFRTMSTNAPKDSPTRMLQNATSFITPVGKFLRATSLDELPQFLNILKGEMSFVGPRPVICNELDLIEAREAVGANDVLPGLTGWAQINGRDELSVDVKARYDGEYVRRRSFLFDLKCLFGTVYYVLRREGIREGASPERKEEKRGA